MAVIRSWLYRKAYNNIPIDIHISRTPSALAAATRPTAAAQGRRRAHALAALLLAPAPIMLADLCVPATAPASMAEELRGFLLDAARVKHLPRWEIRISRIYKKPPQKYNRVRVFLSARRPRAR